MNKFLFELGTEEIPAPMIVPALEALRRSFEKLLEENRVPWEAIKTCSSPRRLAVIVEGLPRLQPDQEEVVTGPPKSVGLRPDGGPTPAGEGFARKLGVPVARLIVIDTERGPYLAYKRKVKGKPVAEILASALPQIIASLSWPKNMCWSESRFRFVRPLRWFVVLWNRKKIPFEFEGVKAGNTTSGHRFLGQGRIRLLEPDEYLPKLRENYVLADEQERRSKILHEIAQETPSGLKVLSDPELLETVVHLNEYPTVVRGSFSGAFLHIPQEVLVTVMRHHQKYLSVVNGNNELQPYFLAVANAAADRDGLIRLGHEKVLKARLEDAAFFWQADRKVPLQDRVAQLEHVLFQERLGTYRDKTERIRALCRDLGGDSHLDGAAQLCKVDLATGMVRELTELQGVMGGLYAREEGYPEEVWKAIYEHYKPAALEDDSPSTRRGALLSIADKLDTLVGCFSVDIIPSGSSDPFALRRQGQGLVKILFDHRLDFSLPWLVETAQRNFSLPKASGQTRGEVLEFLQRRVRFILQNKGIPYDVLNAVLAVEMAAVYSLYEKAQALMNMRGEADFEAVAAAYKRIKNILARQPIELDGVNAARLLEKEELDLYRAFHAIDAAVREDLKGGKYTEALRQIAGLRTTVDRFFDKVLVLTDADELRRNRLRLLYEVSEMFLRVADISEIVMTEDKVLRGEIDD